MVEWGEQFAGAFTYLIKELSDFLKRKPDIFVYGEAGSPTKRGLFLTGYKILLHRAQTVKRSSFRRGLAIFYLEKHSEIVSRGYVSDKFDIFWIRLSKPGLKVFYCFFYAPGSHHPTSVHTDFYTGF